MPLTTKTVVSRKGEVDVLLIDNNLSIALDAHFDCIPFAILNGPNEDFYNDLYTSTDPLAIVLTTRI